MGCGGVGAGLRGVLRSGVPNSPKGPFGMPQVANEIRSALMSFYE